MLNVKVSIITPCYNSRKTIEKTLESVLHQTYSDIEYIVIDGGSVDGTLDIIKEYMPLFQGRMQYISERDEGVYSAMNKGLKKATGDLIGIINSDDQYETDAVEAAVSNLDGHPYEVIYGYCTYKYRNGYQMTMKNNHLDLDKEMIPHPTCFVTRKTYDRYGIFSEKYKIVSDYELMLRFHRVKEIKFIQIPETMASFMEGGLSSGEEAEKEKALLRKSYGLAACEMTDREIRREFEKHKKLFVAGIRWIQLKQENKNIADVLLQMGYHEIAIYGMSMLGERLVEELKNSKVVVSYYIDKVRTDVYEGICAKKPETELELVDAVIVTAIASYDQIVNTLRNKIACPVLSLEDIMSKM